MPLVRADKYPPNTARVSPRYLRKFAEIGVGDTVYCIDEQVWVADSDSTLLVVRRDHMFSTIPTEAFRNRITRVHPEFYTILLSEDFTRDDAPKFSPNEATKARDWPSSCVLNRIV
jgi:hypothetical protein